MKNQYDIILMQILDETQPDPIVIVKTDREFSSLRAGLSASKKALNTLYQIEIGRAHV